LQEYTFAVASEGKSDGEARMQGCFCLSMSHKV
jgi:hypothetical protein